MLINKNYYLTILLVYCLFHLSYAQNKSLTDWKSDFDILIKDLPEKHCNLYTLKGKEYFEDGINQIRKKAAKQSHIETAIQLQQLLATMGDSHTQANWGQFIDKEAVLPLYLYWFSDGLYVLQSSKKNEALPGKKILYINNTPIERIIDSLKTMITNDNDALVKKSIPNLLPAMQLLKYFGFVRDSIIEISYEDQNGKGGKHILSLDILTNQNSMMAPIDSMALCYQNNRSFFIDYYLEEDNTYYIQYNKCWSKELQEQYRNGRNADKYPSFEEFKAIVFNKIRSNDFHKMVFDIRFNGGGNSEQGTKFIEEIIELLEKRKDMTKIFLIVGRQTFSSAIINVMDFKRLSDVIIVGEETSGKPNHFGEVKQFKLPSSGLIISYSTKHFTHSAEFQNTIIPDVIIESSYKDFSNGIDPVYEWIKTQ